MTSADHDAVLEANALFYAAFEDRNLMAMDAMWSADADIACVHPGWPPIRGRDDVMRSWKAVFENSDGVTPVCDGPTCQVHGDSAYVLCRERLDNAVLIATNLFVRRDGAWALVHRHSSPLARVPATPPIDPDFLPN